MHNSWCVYEKTNVFKVFILSQKVKHPTSFQDTLDYFEYPAPRAKECTLKMFFPTIPHCKSCVSHCYELSRKTVRKVQCAPVLIDIRNWIRNWSKKNIWGDPRGLFTAFFCSLWPQEQKNAGQGSSGLKISESWNRQRSISILKLHRGTAYCSLQLAWRWNWNTAVLGARCQTFQWWALFLVLAPSLKESQVQPPISTYNALPSSISAA